jgi:hypothetical protein
MALLRWVPKYFRTSAVGASAAACHHDCVSNKSRWRGYPRAPQPHRDGPPRPGLDYDPSREGSPYTFEGGIGRGWNVIGSLTSRDPRFRRMATRRMTFLWTVSLLPMALVAVALILRAI